MKRGILRTIGILILGLWMTTLHSFTANVAAQQLCRFDWARRVSGLGEDVAKSVATDNFGNVYITGRFEQEIVLGTQTLTSAGGTDIFLAKYDERGNLVWAKRMGGLGNDGGTALAADGTGNLFLSGYFSDRSTFGSFTLLSRGETDIFLVKLNANGTAQYAKRAGSITADEGTGITLDGAGNIILTGNVSNESNFTGTNLVLPNIGGNDIFVAKYSPLGNILWGRIAGSTLDDESGTAVAVDGTNAIYLTGYFRGQASFVNKTQNSLGESDIFITRIDASGNFQWVEKAGGAFDDKGLGITVSASGKSYLTGLFRDNALFGMNPVTSTGGTDAFLAIYDNTGQPQNVAVYGSIADDAGLGLTKESSGKVFMTGYFGGPMTFGTQNLIHQGSKDIFVSRHAPDGVLDWVYAAGGANSDESAGVASTPDGQVYIAGYFNATAGFDAIPLTASSTLSDPFVAKLCNFTPRPCEMTITVETKNETFVRNDGAIIVKSVTGVPQPYGYSLDNITFQTQNTFANLKGGDYTLYVQNASGCFKSVPVTVKDECADLFGAKFVGLDDVYCVNHPAVPLKVEADAGVSFQVLGFTGSGVGVNEFDPANAGLGNHEIIAAIKFASNGCTVQLKKTIKVQQNLDATITGLDDFYCWSQTRADVLTASPAGGVFAGPGITGNTFRPGDAGVGTHQIDYIFNGPLCTYVASKTVKVGGEGSAELIGIDPDYCTNSDPVFFIPTPPGGTVVGDAIGGNAVDGYFFYPSSLGKGKYRISYYGQASDGCPYIIYRYVNVNEPVVPVINPFPLKVCVSAPNPIPLSATPAGGTFAGAGVVNGTFVPSQAGLGVHQLFYVGQDKGCDYMANFNIEVTSAPNANIIGLPGAAVCPKNVDYVLRGVPSNGTFTINDVQKTVFNPAVEGPGQHKVSYIADSNNCLFSKDVFVEVTDLVATIKTLDFSYCQTDQPVRLVGSPYGGTFSGTGVVGDMFYPNLAGPGNFLIKYVGDTAGCLYNIDKAVLVYSQPVAQIFGLTDTYCINDPGAVTLTGSPTGGTFSGLGVFGSNFVPSLVGQTGKVVIEYSGTNGTCTYSIKDTVEIISQIRPEVFNLNSEYCLNDQTDHTISFNPPGGVVVINGVETSTFRPSDLPVGAIFISYAGEVGGCEFAETYSFINTFPVRPTMEPLLPFYCGHDSTPVPLTGTPAGGTFYGNGVINNVFYPKLVGDGFVGIFYAGNYRGCDYVTAAEETVVSTTCCPIPQLGRIQGISTQSVRVNWLASNAGPQVGLYYQFQYRKAGDTVWTTLNNVSNTFVVLNQLQSCQGYEYRVRAFCNTGFWSDFSSIEPFSPLAGTCKAPEDLEALEVTTRTATLAWSLVDGSCPSNAQLQYRKATDIDWITVNVQGTETTLRGLEPNTTYIARVRLRCDSLRYSQFSLPISFTTLDGPLFDCKIPDDFELVAVNVSEAQFDWLPVGGYDHYEISYHTDSDPNWITIDVNNSDFSIISLQENEKYHVRVRTFCIIGGSSDYSDTITFIAPPRPVVCPQPTNLFPATIDPTTVTMVWDFVPEAVVYEFQYRLAGEVNWNTHIVTVPTETIQSLNPFNQYETRVRTVCTSNNPSDYSVVFLIPPRDFCPVPDNFRLTDYTSETFTAEWDIIPNAISYELEYREVGTNAWISETTFAPFVVVSGLNPFLRYEVRVRTNCLNAKSGYALTVIVPIRELCPTPVIQFLDTPDEFSANISWFGTSQADEYEVCWKLKNSVNCLQTQFVSGGTNFASITGLTPDTDYQVRIRARCPGDNSDVVIQGFSTPSSRLGQNTTPEVFRSLEVYPNPNKGDFKVTFRVSERSAVQIQLIDVTGKTVFKRNENAEAGLHELDLTTDVSTGVYLLQLRAGTSLKTVKVVIE